MISFPLLRKVQNGINLWKFSKQSSQIFWKINQSFSQKNIKKVQKQKSSKSGLKQFIKTKEEDRNLQAFMENKSLQYQIFSQLKLMYWQFLPCIIMLSHSLAHMNQTFNPIFLVGPNMIQMYLSAMLFSHSNFKRNYNRMALTIIGATVANLLPGMYTLIGPIIMAVLVNTTQFAILDNPYKSQATEKQQIRVKVLLNIKGVYFFAFVFLIILKLVHFQAVISIQKKFKNIDQSNKADKILNDK